jgi:hypothetical protein
MMFDKVDAVTVGSGGLKCDTEGCDWRDPDISLEKFAAYVDFPCPKCGASVLTQQDYEAVQVVMTLVHEVNAIAEALPTDELLRIMGADLDPDLANVPVKMKVGIEDGEVVISDPVLVTH